MQLNNIAWLDIKRIPVKALSRENGNLATANGQCERKMSFYTWANEKTDYNVKVRPIQPSNSWKMKSHLLSGGSFETPKCFQRNIK